MASTPTSVPPQRRIFLSRVPTPRRILVGKFCRTIVTRLGHRILRTGRKLVWLSERVGSVAVGIAFVVFVFLLWTTGLVIGISHRGMRNASKILRKGYLDGLHVQKELDK